MSHHTLLAESSHAAARLQRVLTSVHTQSDVFQSADFHALPFAYQGVVFRELQKKSIPLQPLSGRGGWWPISIREPYTGAWQRNDEVRTDTVLSFSAVFACTTLIMGDLGKTSLRLVELDKNGIWNEVENAAFSPVLRKPNRYQNFSEFIETWGASRLNSGNAYVWKVRDRRSVVTELYVLDPTRVTPLVAQNGDVYYELKRDDLSGLPKEVVTVPASEIIHNRMNCLFHPLVGLSPIFACALAAKQGLAIQSQSTTFFENRSAPDGILTAPVGITDDQAIALQATWKARTPGDIAVLAGELKYQALSMTAVDAQLIEQLKMTAETVCTAYHVPPYMVDIGPPPPYANVEPVIQKYYSQCLQIHFNSIEGSLDDGFRLGREFGNNYGTEFNPDDLIWMDAAAKSKAAQDGIGSGGMAPNEARKRYFGLGPVAGGETPFMQNQMWPLKQLAERETPAAPALPAMPVVTDEAVDEDDEFAEAASLGSLLLKTFEEPAHA